MRFTGVLLFLTPVVLTPAQAFFQRARLLDRFLSAPSMDLVRQQAALFRDEKVERFDKRAVLGSAPPAWTDAASNHALYAAINESGTWESPEQLERQLWHQSSGASRDVFQRGVQIKRPFCFVPPSVVETIWPLSSCSCSGISCTQAHRSPAKG